MKDSVNGNLYYGPHICEEKGSSSKSNIGEGLFHYFDEYLKMKLVAWWTQ